MKTLIKTLLITAGVIFGILLLCCILLYLAQDKLIFFPRKYGSVSTEIVKRYEKLEFKTARNGRQLAYYAGPKDNLPKKLWILTGGNGSLALGWGLVVASASKQRPEYGFLLVEYPGYGDCQGKPSRIGIQGNMEGALSALAVFLKSDEQTLKSRSSFLGHSLGCAVALEAAAKWNRGEVIALSPFTSMKDMAARTVGGPLPNLVRHQWDNRVSILDISKLKSAEITIFHGTADQIIPVAMSRELAALSPTAVEFNQKSKLGHNNIVAELREELIARIIE